MLLYWSSLDSLICLHKVFFTTTCSESICQFFFVHIYFKNKYYIVEYVLIPPNFGLILCHLSQESGASCHLLIGYVGVKTFEGECKRENKKNGLKIILCKLIYVI